MLVLVFIHAHTQTHTLCSQIPNQVSHINNTCWYFIQHTASTLIMRRVVWRRQREKENANKILHLHQVETPLFSFCFSPCLFLSLPLSTCFLWWIRWNHDIYVFFCQDPSSSHKQSLKDRVKQTSWCVCVCVFATLQFAVLLAEVWHLRPGYPHRGFEPLHTAWGAPAFSFS